MVARKLSKCPFSPGRNIVEVVAETHEIKLSLEGRSGNTFQPSALSLAL